MATIGNLPYPLVLRSANQAAERGFSLPLVRFQKPQNSSSSTSDKQGESNVGGDGAGGGISSRRCLFSSSILSSSSVSTIGTILKPPCLGTRFLRGRLDVAYAVTSLSDRFGLDFSHCCASASRMHRLLAASSGKRTKSLIGGETIWSPRVAMGFLRGDFNVDFCFADADAIDND